jgi:hypothetical protein
MPAMAQPTAAAGPSVHPVPPPQPDAPTSEPQPSAFHPATPSLEKPAEPPGAPITQSTNSPAGASSESHFAAPLYKEDSLELIRKVCLRFHAVTRQLRLRKDYRATLEVEDDYDLQDLLCALLRVEFDEVGFDEWIPPYTDGAPRTALLLHRDQIAVVVKKTRPGLTTKELADQVAADSAHYGAREQCTTLFCFIYDPEGRIGSPKRLETDLTSVSDRYMIEVLVAPK